MKKTIFVLGAGNGCGNHVAEKFGRNDWCILGKRRLWMARKWLQNR